MGQRVLIVYSDTGPPAQLVANLLAEQDVTAVELFDAMGATPTLDDLNPYNLVVTWSNFPYADQNAAGDVLADYQDSGQGLVIPLVFSFYDGVWGLFGRWRNEATRRSTTRPQSSSAHTRSAPTTRATR